MPGYRDFVRVASGGFSTVYSAHQIQFDRRVAVKVLNSDPRDVGAVRRFVRECRAAGRLSDHPEIATVLDAGATSDGRPFIAMQYFPHGSLADWLDDVGPLAPAQTLSVVATVARALRAAHTDGLLHRDVKPANVLVTSTGAVVLSDFGVAGRVHGPEGAASSQSAFTPQYTAPEVLNGQRYPAAADVYALGVTAYALLAGTPPFAPRPGEGPAKVLQRIVAGDAPPLHADVPEPLRALVARMADVDPARRPNTDEVCTELTRLSETIGSALLPVAAVDAGAGDGIGAGVGAGVEAGTVVEADSGAARSLGLEMLAEPVEPVGARPEQDPAEPSRQADQTNPADPLGQPGSPAPQPSLEPSPQPAGPTPPSGRRRRRGQLAVGAAAIGLLLAAGAVALPRLVPGSPGNADPPVTTPTVPLSPTPAAEPPSTTSPTGTTPTAPTEGTTPAEESTPTEETTPSDEQSGGPGQEPTQDPAPAESPLTTPGESASPPPAPDPEPRPGVTTVQAPANELSPQFLEGNCVYRIWYGNYGEAPFAKIRVYAGDCGGITLAVTARRGSTTTDFGDADWSGGRDSCGSYFEGQATGQPPAIAVGQTVHFPNTGRTLSFRYDSGQPSGIYSNC